MWIPPTVAAIQHHHLGVIRQWVFAVSWLTAAATRDVATQLVTWHRSLSAWRRHIKSGPRTAPFTARTSCLIMTESFDLVDAVANQDGMHRWFDASVDPSLTEPSIMSLHRRKQTDLEDLIRLIAHLSAAWRQPWTEQLVRRGGQDRRR